MAEKLIGIGSGFIRKDVIDSIVIKRGDDYLWKIITVGWYRESSPSAESPYRHDFMMDTCGMGYIFVRVSMKPEIQDICMDVLGKIPELVTKIDPCNSPYRRNFTVYMKGITVADAVMLKLAIE